ncbi:MAG TPA: phosphatidate cytidylyltransferase [Steroidobacteraceae bacterium]|jgi:phosphatidate cytidylyltransferase|nr:phosphatidate cytidylyltransferase [Steroidobacteraceae bacterium]
MLRSRILTALALAILCTAAIIVCPPPVTSFIFGAITLIGAWEWSAFLATQTIWRVLYVVLLAVLGALIHMAPLSTAGFVLMLEVAVGWWIVALFWIVLAPQRGGALAAGLAGAFALLPTWVALARIDAGWVGGPEWTLFILVLAFSADTGAFFAGRQFGRTHLAPRVSPNKTWEGVIGGMLLAAGVAAAGAGWFRLSIGGFIGLCLAAAGFSVVGDLVESLLKRHVHLKDSGRLFPGHGGMLDRIDSVTAATPVMALGLIWLGAGK